jgi:hypothetical protein
MKFEELWNSGISILFMADSLKEVVKWLKKP